MEVTGSQREIFLAWFISEWARHVAGVHRFTEQRSRGRDIFNIISGSLVPVTSRILVRHNMLATCIVCSVFFVCLVDRVTDDRDWGRSLEGNQIRLSLLYGAVFSHSKNMPRRIKNKEIGTWYW